MLQKIWNALVYAGVDKYDYDRVRPEIQKTNRTMTTVLSFFASILIACMFVTSCFSEALLRNRNVYALGFLLSLAVFILSITVAKKRPGFITFLVHVSYSVFYIFGIMIGIISDPDGKTVTFMVLIVFMQILFADRPIHSITVTGIYIFIFIGLCYSHKVEPVLSLDVANALVFGILGASSSTVINNIKVRKYLLEDTLRAVKLVDALTDMKDSKAYAIECDTIASKCKNSLACVFIDVNGLHRINNELGHEEGDRMLRTIANEIKGIFTGQYAFRIGGDEFVVFIPEVDETKLLELITELKEKVKESNYYIAVGYSITQDKRELRHLDIASFVKDADAFMFKDKARFYKGRDNGDRMVNTETE